MSKLKKIEEDTFLSAHKPAEPILMEDSLSESGLIYADYVIRNRALIGEDGMKPINRRILYGMYMMGAKPGSKTIKGGRIVGDVMGKYHPHGDASIEDAQARMGLAYAMRIPMFEIQGALSNFPGKKPAAPRYYEITLNKCAWELVRDIQDKACTMQYTEMGDDVEPTQLPVRYPYGIINGTDGIAVGYASEIPPHNPTEVMDACVAFLKNKLKNPKDVMKYILGPDLPTGGQVLGTDGIEEYITTGRGKFVIRGRYHVEQVKRKTQITFYELPFQVSCEQVIIAVNNAQKKNKLLEVSEVKDLSDGRKGIKLVIYVKQGSNIDKVIDELWKTTPLQVNFNVNSTILLDKTPHEDTTLLEMIEQFIVHKRNCYIRKTNYRIKKLITDSHHLAGVATVLLDLDKTIAIIRGSDTVEKAISTLQKEFSISKEQATYILGMKLRTLTKSDKHEIEQKYQAVLAELKDLEETLADDDKMTNRIIKELEDTKKIIQDERRTDIINVTNEEIANMAKEQAKKERQLGKDIECFITFDGNKIGKIITEQKNTIRTTSLASLYAVTDDGKAIEIPVDNIPLDNYTGVNSLLSEKANVIGIHSESYLGTLLVSSYGNANIVKSGEVKEGNFVSLLPGERIILARNITKEDFDSAKLAIIDNFGKIAYMKLSTIRQTRQGAGLINASQMDSVIGSDIIKTDLDVLVTYTQNGEIKYTAVEDCPVKGRGGKGYLLHKLKGPDTVIKFEVIAELPENAVYTNRGARAK